MKKEKTILDDYKVNSEQYNHVLEQLCKMESRRGDFKKTVGHLEGLPWNIETKIDMIRFRLTETKEEECKYLLNTFNILHEGELTTEYREWTGVKINQYKFNWNMTVNDPISGKKFTVYIGYKHNSKSDNVDLVIEYNPQKVQRHWRGWNRIRNFIYERMERVVVQSYDVAFDIHDLHIDDLLFELPRMREYKQMTKNGNTTHYLGKGVAKIYNKKLEYEEVQGIKIDNELTRLEVTIKPKKPLLVINTCEYDMPTFPILYGKGTELKIPDDMKLNETDRFIIRAIMDNPKVNDIRDLGRKMQKKIRKCLSYAEFAPTADQVRGALELYLSYEYKV